KISAMIPCRPADLEPVGNDGRAALFPLPYTNVQNSLLLQEGTGRSGGHSSEREKLHAKEKVSLRRRWCGAVDHAPSLNRYVCSHRSSFRSRGISSGEPGSSWAR